MLPTVEAVSIFLVKYLQDALPHVPVQGLGDRTAIEVVDPLFGEPIQEAQEGPRVSLFGPRELADLNRWRKPTAMRAVTGRNAQAGTFTERPMPKRTHLTFEVRGQATRQSTETTNVPVGEQPVPGYLWLMERVLLALDDIRIKDASWTVPVPGFTGYFVEWVQRPRLLAGSGSNGASLYVFQGTCRVKDVRLFRGTETSGSLATSVELQVRIPGEGGTG